MANQPSTDASAQPKESEAREHVTRQLPAPPRAEDLNDLVWQQLTVQFHWYDKAASRNRLAYLILKVAALVAGAAVTVLAASSAPAVLTASLAGLIVVMEGIHQLFQCHRNWLSYRATAETLRHHAFLYVAEVVPYNDPAGRRDLLASFLRDLTANENTQWAAAMTRAEPALRSQ